MPVQMPVQGWPPMCVHYGRPNLSVWTGRNWIWTGRTQICHRAQSGCRSDNKGGGPANSVMLGQSRLFNVHSPPHLLLCLLAYHARRKSLSVCNGTGTETRKARDWVRCPATFHLHRWAQAGLQGDHGCSTYTVVRWLTRRVAGSAQETGGTVPAGAGGGVLRQ